MDSPKHVEVPRYPDADYWHFVVVDRGPELTAQRVDLEASFVSYGGYILHVTACSLPRGDGWLEDLAGSVEHPWVVTQDGREIAASDGGACR